MKIIYLKLFRYKRFMLNNIETLEYSPNKIIQLIAGTNGSGKSSLMEELSPLPANIKKDYHENGFKEIHIKKNNDLFILTSGKVSSTKHEFILNSVNLNTGGTKKVQLELCKQYFNITPMIHEILTNRKNLTDMSVTERKQWLTDISTIDYKYPLQVFKRIQTTYRDILGGIKLLDAKLTTLETSIISDDELELKEKEISELKKFLYETISRKKEIKDVKFNIETIENLNIRSEKLIRYLERLPKLEINNIQEAEHKLKILKEEENLYLDKLSKIQDLNNGDKKLILKELKEKELFLNNSEIKESDIENYKKLFINFESILKYLNNLTEYSNEDIRTINLENLSKKSDYLQKEIKKIDNDISVLYNDFRILDSLKNNSHTECPNCNHKWIPGFSENRYKILKEQIESLDVKRKDLENKFENTKYELNRVSEAKQLYNNFIIFLENNNLIDFISKQTSFNLLNNLDNNINTLCVLNSKKEEVNDFIRTLNDYSELKKKLEDIQRVESIMTNIKTMSKEDIEDKINKNHIEQMSLIKTIDILKNRDRTIKGLKYNYDNLLILRKNYKTYKENEYVKVQNRFLDETIDFLHTEIKELENIVNNINYNKRTLENLKKDKQELLIRRDSLKILLDVMSPTEGLIAESILSFIGVFLERINDLISRIWTYDMKLVVPEIGEDNDLDYKFKVIIENDNDPIDDIKLVSSGMKEVINLSHRIIAMQILGLDNYPVYLDEFGSKFDPLHKDKTIEIIKDLSLNYEQIFIISHNQEIFNIFSDCDITILSSDNLFMNDIKKYNEVLKIK